MGGVPSVGVFLRDPSSIYASFGDNNGKLRTASSTSATEDWTWHLPSTSFLTQNRSATGGANDGQFDIHALLDIRNRNLWCSSRLP